MQFLVKAYDGPDILEKRLEVRPRHLAENRNRSHECCTGKWEWQK